MFEKSWWKKYAIRIAVLMIIIVVGIYFFNFFNITYFPNFLSTEQEEWAYFGSYIGGTLGALLAFMSLVILLDTFDLQKEELSIAGEALKKSAKSHEKQVENYEVQKFESTFYSLLDLHNQTLRELNIDNKKLKSWYEINERLGRLDSFDKLVISNVYPEWKEKEGDDLNIEVLKLMQKNILNEVELSQYFRVLYQVLKFIAKNNINNKSKVFDVNYLKNKNDLSENDEKMYASLVRSFVPVKLLPVLAINCICGKEGYLHNLDKYQALIERYSFLEHMRLNDLETNLGSFLILDSYSKALGDKEKQDIEDKALDIQAAYPQYFDNSFFKVGGYLKIYSKPNIELEV